MKSCCARRCRRRRWRRRWSERSDAAIRTVPVVRLQDMNGVFDESIGRPRLLAQLLGAFAGLALLLAAIGTYGVLSYMVAERRREIGIRMASARRAAASSQVMKQGLVIAAIGIVVGLAGALRAEPVDRVAAVRRAADRSRHAGRRRRRSRCVAAVACGLPAWRASRVDPNVVLRGS